MDILFINDNLVKEIHIYINTYNDNICILTYNKHNKNL